MLFTKSIEFMENGTPHHQNKELWDYFQFVFCKHSINLKKFKYFTFVFEKIYHHVVKLVIYNKGEIFINF
jgi:hypothetical protein